MHQMDLNSEWYITKCTSSYIKKQLNSEWSPVMSQGVHENINLNPAIKVILIIWWVFHQSNYHKIKPVDMKKQTKPLHPQRFLSPLFVLLR